jgi:hypothetical protein
MNTEKIIEVMAVSMADLDPNPNAFGDYHDMAALAPDTK